MLEQLKAERTHGFGPKERTRLSVSVALCLVIGSVIYANRGCSEETIGTPPAPLEPPKPPPGRPLDSKPLEALRARGGDSPTWDLAALDHLLYEVRTGELRREPEADLTPAQVDELDPKQAPGQLLEVRGRVRAMDVEEFSSPTGRRGVNQVWVFAVDGEDGRSVVVAHGANANDVEGGRPADAYKAETVRRIRDGDVIRVRGLYLQRRTGTAGKVVLDGPTPVLVGKEYRITSVPPPPPASLRDIDWTQVEDRLLHQTRTVEDPTHYRAFTWARAQGRPALLEDLKTGRLPEFEWGQKEAVRFLQDLDADGKTDDDAADARTWTRAQRGKVFYVAGEFGRVDEEDWTLVPPNGFDVNRRWNFWLVHRNTSMRFDSAWPLSAYPGLTGRKGEFVVFTGVYTRSFSYVAVKDGKEVKEATTPCFVLLDARVRIPYVRRPATQTFFFWVTVSLIVLGILFYVVLIRGERRESGEMEQRKLALRKRIRAAEAARGAGAPPLAPANPPEGGSDDAPPDGTPPAP